MNEFKSFSEIPADLLAEFQAADINSATEQANFLKAFNGFIRWQNKKQPQIILNPLPVPEPPRATRVDYQKLYFDNYNVNQKLTEERFYKMQGLELRKVHALEGLLVAFCKANNVDLTQALKDTGLIALVDIGGNDGKGT